MPQGRQKAQYQIWTEDQFETLYTTKDEEDGKESTEEETKRTKGHVFQDSKRSTSSGCSNAKHNYETPRKKKKVRIVERVNSPILRIDSPQSFTKEMARPKIRTGK